jgi:hypothetical protein
MEKGGEARVGEVRMRTSPHLSRGGRDSPVLFNRPKKRKARVPAIPLRSPLSSVQGLQSGTGVPDSTMLARAPTPGKQSAGGLLHNREVKAAIRAGGFAYCVQLAARTVGAIISWQLGQYWSYCFLNGEKPKSDQSSWGDLRFSPFKGTGPRTCVSKPRSL